MVKINEKYHRTKNGKIKKNPKRKNADDKYFEKYFEETNKVHGYHDMVTKGKHVYEYNFTNEDIVKILQNLHPNDKKTIREKMVKIDFNNGNMQDFINYFMKEYTRRQRS